MDNRRFYCRVEPQDAVLSVIYANHEREISAQVVNVSEDGICLKINNEDAEFFQNGDAVTFSLVAGSFGVVTDKMIVKHVDTQKDDTYIGGSCSYRSSFYEYVSQLKCQLWKSGKFLFDF